jgi:hypothetical protein
MQGAVRGPARASPHGDEAAPRAPRMTVARRRLWRREAAGESLCRPQGAVFSLLPQGCQAFSRNSVPRFVLASSLSEEVAGW